MRRTIALVIILAIFVFILLNAGDIAQLIEPYFAGEASISEINDSFVDLRNRRSFIG